MGYDPVVRESIGAGLFESAAADYGAPSSMKHVGPLIKDSSKFLESEISVFFIHGVETKDRIHAVHGAR